MKCFWHAYCWKHFYINLHCPKQCCVERSETGLGSCPAAWDVKDGYVLPLSTRKRQCCPWCCIHTPSCCNAQPFTWYSKHIWKKQKFLSEICRICRSWQKYHLKTTNWPILGIICFITSANIYLCITDDDFEWSRTFNYLNKIKKRFQTTYSSRAQMALPYVMNKCNANPANFILANRALYLSCRLVCLWLLCLLREKRKTFCSEMKAETWLGSFSFSS